MFGVQTLAQLRTGLISNIIPRELEGQKVTLTLTLTHFSEYRPTAPFSGGRRDSQGPGQSYT